jgi:type 1 fimbria pilin
VATVIVHGEAGRPLRIDVPPRMDLFSLEGSRLTFDQLETDAPDVPKLDVAGNLTFHIGGRLRFLGSEDGDFRGDLPITVEYQ